LVQLSRGEVVVGGLRFGVLGELRVLRGGAPQRLPVGKPRRLLATLLLNPDQFVSTDLLVDALWDGNPPRSALANVRTYVRTLRTAIDAPDTLLETLRSGYRITLDGAVLDADELAASVAEATRLRQAGDDAGAVAAYERGRRLWRGRPLSDLAPTPAWDGPIGRLESLHRTTLDELIAIHLATAEHAAAAELLRARLVDEPYDEDLWRQLVECTLATGRRYEAGMTYAEAVRTLAEELGVEPGEALRTVGARTGGPQRPPVGRPVPRQLPLDTPDFTGRERELDELARALDGSGASRPAVAVVFGAPGTGKTTLAVHCGHQLLDAFPDGQIYLDMRATSRRRDPANALYDLLASLGVPDLAIPQDIDRRAALLRSELAGRRVLIVLDDVASAAQVGALLPGTGATAMVITSRQRLSDLVGATRIRLDVMGDEAAAHLLRAAATDKVEAGDRAIAEIVRACGNLPLAIRIAGGRLAQRSDLTPGMLARRLRDERTRLAELRIADLAMVSSADLSYRSLGEPEARLYRLIGLLGAVDFPACTIGTVASGQAVERCLDTMIEANLVQVTGVDRTGTTRYRMHDLLRLHAGEWARRHGGQARTDLATVLDGSLARVRVASRLLPVRFFGVWESADAPSSSPEGPLRTSEEALTWHELTEPNLVPSLHAAREQGLHDLAWRLGAAWTPYFDLRGHFDAWQEAGDMALHSAREAGSRRGEATILCGLAQLGLYRDEWEASYDGFATARDLFRDLGLRSGAGTAAAGLASWHNARGEPDAARPWAMEALAAFVDAGDRRGEAVARNAIGGTVMARGGLDEAREWFAGALDLARQLGDEHREAQVRRRIATLRERQQDLDGAITELRAALATFERLRDEQCAARTRATLGGVLLLRGDRTAARHVLLEALTVVHRLGDVNLTEQTTAQLAQCG
jgi:DNA-binding SARP family transcriptional activator/tetratricopeptide (TPR) repeat protein